jgi:hypothetical protein
VTTSLSASYPSINELELACYTTSGDAIVRRAD